MIHFKVLLYAFGIILLSATSVSAQPDRDVDKPLAKQEVAPSTESGHHMLITAVETMPEFPGGERALLKFIRTNIRYPEVARKAKIEGRVVVRFVVDEQGKLKDPVIMRSLSPECDEEALRLIRSMPLWRPGLQNGRGVKIHYTLPIVFKHTQTQ